MTPHDPKLVRELKDDLLKVWGNLEAGCKDSLALCRAIDFLEAFQSPPAREEDLRERLISKLQEMWSQMELGSISEMRLFSFIDQIEGILKPARAAEGDVSKNRQNLNISERHNEKSDDSQYVSVPKDAFNELIRLVKYEAVVALEQSRMSVSLVEDIRNAIKSAEGES